MTSALKLRQIVDNAENVIAIELLIAAEGLDYRLPLRSSPRIERARGLIRSFVPRLAADRSLSREIGALAQAVRRGDFAEFCS
jgi:histidine ammonia-lyase